MRRRAGERPGAPILAGGESSSATTNVTVPPNVPAGVHYVVAVADSTGIVPESNEANNVGVGNRVTISP